MRRLALALAIVLLPTIAQAQPRPAFPAGAEAREARLLAHAGPQTRSFLAVEAAREARAGAVSEAEARAVVRNNAPMLGAMGEGDIEALVFLVMMQASRDQDADLRDIMAQTQAANRQKQALRDQMATRRQDQAQADARLRAQYDSLRASGRIAPSTSFADYAANRRLQFSGPPVSPRPGLRVTEGAPDSMGDMSEMQQMRLQMVMDRRQKAFEILLNLMKKVDDTQSTILGNLK